MKRINELFLLGCISAGVAVFAACPSDTGGGDAGVEGCTEDADCADGEACQVYTGECVATCTADEDCGDATPVCIPEDSTTALVTGICGCDDTSCADDEVCHPTANVCVTECDPAAEENECNPVGEDDYTCFANDGVDAFVCQVACEADADCPNVAPICDLTAGQCIGRCDGQEEFRLDCDEPGGEICDTATGKCIQGCDGDADCDPGEQCNLANGECFAACTEIGSNAAPCGADEVCVPGDPNNSCEAECVDDTCLLDEELCSLDTTVDTFNACIAPDDETGWCDNAAASALSHTAGSPVIVNVVNIASSTAGNCTGTVEEFEATVYAPGGLLDDGNTNGGQDPLSINTRWFVISEDGSASYGFDFPGGMQDAANPDFYYVTFESCYEGLATYLAAVNADDDLVANGGATNTSNVYCFDPVP